jgi:hypothetical protein
MGRLTAQISDRRATKRDGVMHSARLDLCGLESRRMRTRSANGDIGQAGPPGSPCNSNLRAFDLSDKSAACEVNEVSLCYQQGPRRGTNLARWEGHLVRRVGHRWAMHATLKSGLRANRQQGHDRFTAVCRWCSTR